MEIVQEKLSPIITSDITSEILLLVSTNKGGFIYYTDEKRKNWEVNGPYLLGSIIHHMVLDNRDNSTILMAGQTKQHGCCIFKSTDFGMNWIPTKFPANLKNGEKINHIFRIAIGHKEEPDVWYAGVSPQGLFRSNDNGNTWDEIESLSENINLIKNNKLKNNYKYEKLHSIIINPKNMNDITIGMTNGGIYKSKDHGKSWFTINTNENVESYILIQHPDDYNVVYEQNKSGIFKYDLDQNHYKHIGQGIDVGDQGFALAIHPKAKQTLWTFPMEGTDVWSRVCTGGQPAIYSTKNNGKDWYRQDVGFPIWHAWFTVMSKGLSTDSMDTCGLYLGTTCGSIWFSENEGNSWRQIVAHLPKIYSIETGYIHK